MRRTMISSLVAIGLLVSRPGLAADPAPAAKVAQLQALHGQAQALVQRYNVTFDTAHLAAASDLLVQWLVEHRSIYGTTAEANAVRAPIEQQLGMIDAELLRVRAISQGAPAVPVVMPVAAPPPRPAMTPEQATDLRRARAWLGGGAVSLSLGSAVLLGASMPLWLLRERALRRANEETFYADEQQLVSRARRRHAGAIASFVVGASLAGAGIAMLTVGGVKRARVRRELSLAPALGPGFAGGSATLRF